jgi:hypothetical protein
LVASRGTKRPIAGGWGAPLPPPPDLHFRNGSLSGTERSLSLEQKGWLSIERAIDGLLRKAEEAGDDVQLAVLREMREAGQAALDRTLGRPKQRMEAKSVSVGATVEELQRLTNEELEALIAGEKTA